MGSVRQGGVRQQVEGRLNLKWPPLWYQQITYSKKMCTLCYLLVINYIHFVTWNLDVCKYINIFRKVHIKRFGQTGCCGFHFVFVELFQIKYLESPVYSISLSFKNLVLPSHFLEFKFFCGCWPPCRPACRPPCRPPCATKCQTRKKMKKGRCTKNLRANVQEYKGKCVKI